MTISTKKIFFILFVLLATPLSGEVFAQSVAEDTELFTNTEEATTTFETTETTDNSLAEEGDTWYRLEKLSGENDRGDFLVGSGKNEIKIKPGETIVQEISVANRISDNRTFKFEIEDATGSDDGSRAVRLTGDDIGPYSIRDYLSIPAETIELDLGDLAYIPVTITMPPNAEPGGYYGAVLVSTIQTDDNNSPNVARSPIISRVASLFFVTVEGETEIAGETQELSLINGNGWYQSGPIEMGILYENTGSVHLNPYGEVSITNMLGEEVGFIELEPWYVLPTSLRVREITWDREFLLGRYNVTAKINRGYDDIIDEVTVSFWVLPWKIVGVTFLVIFIIIFTIRAFFRKFEFKRR